MGDLALLLDLIKNLAHGQSIDLATLCRHLNFDTQSECVIARATSPCAAEAVARDFAFLGVRPAALCADVASIENKFTRWYSRRLLTNLHIDVKPASFDQPHRGAVEVYSLANVLTTSGITCAQEHGSARATRPASVAHGKRIGRLPQNRHPSFGTASKRALSHPNPDPMSPKVTLSLSPSRAHSKTPKPIHAEVPSPRLWRNTIPVESDDESMRSHRAVEDLDPSASEAVSNLSSPGERKAKHVFDPPLKQTVCGIARNFAETPGLLRNLRKSGVARGRIVVLTIEAITKHRKSAAATKLAVKNVNGALRHFLEARSSGDVALTGGKSAALIRDYLEQADRCRTAPAAIRRSLTCWAAALQVDWQLDRAYHLGRCR